MRSPPIRGLVPNLRLPALPSGRHLDLQLEVGLLGGAVWPSAVALCGYLSRQSSLLRSNPLTAELGAGTGAVGLFAAALGARVVLTDVGPLTATGYGGNTRLLRLLRENAHANSTLIGERGGAAHVAELDWGQKAHAEAVKAAHAPDGFELLLASDVIYQAAGHAVKPLASTIARLLRKDAGVALIAYTPRYAEASPTPGVGDPQLAAFQDAVHAMGMAMDEVHETGVADPACDGKTHPVVVMRVWRT